MWAKLGTSSPIPSGPDCDCGRRGCVKVTCMPETLVAHARDAGVLAPADPQQQPSLPEDLAALAQAAADGNPAAREILATSARLWPAPSRC